MKRERQGFTLLEILVAMMIMTMIILMLSAVFKQMTVTWGVGMRKVKANMYSRAAMSQMAQEIALAVADRSLQCTIPASGNGITFYTFNSLTNRAVTRVRYYQSGRQLRRVVRPVVWNGNGSYPTLMNGTAHSLLYNLNSINFSTPSGGTLTTNLPEWVDIYMQIDQDEAVSRAVARSAGPDKLFGTSDDITSIR